MATSLKRFLAVAAALAAIAAARAEEPTYECTITQVRESAAPISAESLASEQRLKAGATFTVVKKTGVMSGALGNASANPPVVVNDGTDRNSYIAVTTLRRGEGGGPGAYVMVLMIAEYANTPVKRFHFVNSVFSYLGSCTSKQSAP